MRALPLLTRSTPQKSFPRLCCTPSRSLYCFFSDVVCVKHCLDFFQPGDGELAMLLNL